MKKGIFFIAVLALLLSGCSQNSNTKHVEVATADDSLELLKKGNSQYLSGNKESVTTQEMRKDLTANGQHPYAVVITCSDSRVPVEEIFSCNAGEIFVIRTAGNVIGGLEMGSVEYGVEHCGAPLVLVLGHTNCGAVTAAVEGETAGNSIDEIIKYINPAVEEAKKKLSDKEDIISEGVRLNVLNGIQQIKADDTIKESIEGGKVSVQGAIYDIESGTVQWFE